jgi:hypothetical protein
MMGLIVWSRKLFWNQTIIEIVIKYIFTIGLVVRSKGSVGIGCENQCWDWTIIKIVIKYILMIGLIARISVGIGLLLRL